MNICNKPILFILGEAMDPNKPIYLTMKPTHGEPSEKLYPDNKKELEKIQQNPYVFIIHTQTQVKNLNKKHIINPHKYLQVP